MSDETQVSDEQPVVDAPQTLDDVISEFNVQAQPAQQDVQNNVQEFKPAQSQHIDPYDEGSLNQWAAETANNQNALQQEVQNLRADADARSKADAQKIIDADIQSAVGKITESVDGIDPLMAELYLNKRAEEHDGFRAAWDNRGKDPKAFDAALRAISGELEGKFQRVDTQIAENHRAAQQSIQSNNTQKAAEYGSPLEEALANAKTEGERQVIWHNAKNLGY